MEIKLTISDCKLLQKEYVLKTEITTKFKPENRISYTLRKEDDFYLHAWDLFEPAVFINNQLILHYKYNGNFAKGLKARGEVQIEIQ